MSAELQSRRVKAELDLRGAQASDIEMSVQYDEVVSMDAHLAACPPDYVTLNMQAPGWPQEAEHYADPGCRCASAGHPAGALLRAAMMLYCDVDTGRVRVCAPVGPASADLYCITVRRSARFSFIMSRSDAGELALHTHQVRGSAATLPCCCNAKRAAWCHASNVPGAIQIW